MPHAMLVSVKRCRQGLACKAQVALTGSCRCASTGGGAPCGARAQAEKHRTVRKHRRSRQGRTRAWRGHRLSSTGHPGSERAVEGVEARFLVRAQAEKHRAVRKPTRCTGPHPWRAGHPISARACAHASLVLAIFSMKISSKASVILSGGPPSMMLRSGRPWLSSRESERGRERRT